MVVLALTQRVPRRSGCNARALRVALRLPGPLLLLALVGSLPCAETPAGKKLYVAAEQAVYPQPREEVEALARRDPLEFLRLSLKWYEAKVTSYACQFHKHERVGDKVRKPETIFMKFREKPFSVYMKWTADPSKGQEVIYVEGQYDNKAVVHPSGLLGFIFRKVSLDPEGKIANRHSRRPVTYAGLGNMLRVVIPQCEQAKANGDLVLEYLGVREEAGRPAYVIKRVLPKKHDYRSHQLFIFIDQQFLISVRTEAYLWDGTLLSDYRYTDLEINADLMDEDFDPDNPAYSYRLF